MFSNSFRGIDLIRQYHGETLDEMVDSIAKQKHGVLWRKENDGDIQGDNVAHK